MSETSDSPDTPTANTAKILFVDDEPNILSSLSRLFRSLGFQVRVAESGRAALALLEGEAVDLVISDMHMPEMDGAAFLEQVRQRWPDTIRLLLTDHTDVSTIIAAINRGQIYRYITKPWDDHEIALIVRLALERKALELDKKRLEVMTLRQNEELKSLNASLEAMVEARTAELRVANDSLQDANEQLKANFITSIKVFSTLIEMRGDKLAGHSRRVADLARRIALKLQLDARLAQEIFVAGLLHEIGKVVLPDELLGTPVTMMSTQQLDAYRQHPVRAEQLLMPLQNVRGSAEIIGAQLERFDGTGFPQRLLEHEIPIGARILALASDYDNLQMGTLTQRHLSPEEARTVILQSSRKRYDPEVVAAFVDLLQSAARAEKCEQMSEGPMIARNLQVGMVLSRDLITPSGLLMLSAGHILDEHLIRRIMDFEKSGGLQLTAYVRLLSGE